MKRLDTTLREVMSTYRDSAEWSDTFGLNPWCINEGADPEGWVGIVVHEDSDVAPTGEEGDDLVHLTLEQARRYGVMGLDGKWTHDLLQREIPDPKHVRVWLQGWVAGLQKVSLANLLQEYAGFQLSLAHSLVTMLVAGEEVLAVVPESHVDEFIHKAYELGVEKTRRKS